MKLLIFSIRDSAAEYYQNPVFARTRAEIIRSLALAVSEDGNALGQHAEHFSLFELGSFDALSGVILLHQAPELVINVWDLKGVSGNGLRVTP